MNSFTRLINNIKSANWQGANQTFGEIMQQKVADRLEVEKRTIFKEDNNPDNDLANLKCPKCGHSKDADAKLCPICTKK